MTHAVDRLAPSLTASIDATARPQNNPPQTVATSFVMPDTPEVAAAAELAARSFAEESPPT